MKWFENHHNILTLVRFLVEEKDFDAPQILAVLEKPWHWEDDFNTAEAYYAGLSLADAREATA